MSASSLSPTDSPVPATSPVRPADAPRPAPGTKFSWRTGWPWLAAAIPWVILINYLRLEWSTNEQYGYGFVVPVLSLYLLLQLWPARPDPRPLGQPLWLVVATIFLAALMLPLLLLIEASPEWRMIGWALAAVTTGLTAAFILQRGGWPWLGYFIFPLLFIFAAVPWPTSMEYKVMLPLMRWDAATAVEILNWCGVPAIQHENVIQLPNGLVGVDEACSGIRSLQTSLMIALFVGEWMQLRIVRRLLMLAAALALTYIFNLIRTLALVTLSANWGNATMHQWHDSVGLSILSLSLVGLWALAVLIREKKSSGAIGFARCSAMAAPWSRGLLAGLGLWFVAAFVGTQFWFDWHEARALPPVHWTVTWPDNLPTFQQIEIPVEARTSFMYATDESSAAKWQEANSPSLWLGYFLRWKPGRETSILASTHHPDVCLPATGKPLVADYGITNFKAAGLDFPVRVYQFKDGTEPLFVFFCVWIDGHAASGDAAASAPEPGWLATLRRIVLPFTPASELDYRLNAIAAGRRNQGQQVLELGLWGATNQDEANRQFADELNQLVTRVP